MFLPPLVTLHLSVQCKILSQNHINRDQSSFWNETGGRLGRRTRSLVFPWFSAALLWAHYLVRPRLVWVCLETLSCKHGTKSCFSFWIKLDPVSCKHPLSYVLILICANYAKLDFLLLTAHVQHMLQKNVSILYSLNNYFIK